MSSNVKRFGWIDYIIFIGMFLVAVGIGLYHALAKGGQSSTSKYFMGNRNLGLIPVTLSILVSVVSANTLLGVPAEIYGFGIHMLFRSGSIFVSVTAATVLFVPMFYPLKLTSATEYLELRFKSKLVRVLGTVLLFITQTLYVGCVIFGPAIALETATGVPPWASILLVAMVGTAYTALGGMKAVIWTDTFQSVVMLGGMLAIIILGTNSVGGFERVWDINKQWGRLNVSFSPDPTERMTFWVFLVGYSVYWTGGYGVNQPCVQRYCAMKTERMGKISMLLNGPGFALLNTISAAAGLVVFAHYTAKRCDPLKAGLIGNANQLLPYFVMEEMDFPGIPGLFIACLFSGSLSTLSSSINSMSAVIWEDVLKSHFEHLTESQKTFITKILVVIFGIVCMGVSFLVWAIGGNLVQIIKEIRSKPGACPGTEKVSSSFFGAAIGPLLGLFLLGGICPWANWIGAFTGGCSAMTMILWMLMGQTLYKTQRGRLPTPIDGCHLRNVTNFTQLWTTTDVIPLNTTSLTNYPDDSLNSGLRWLYSVSFAWYPVCGVIITVCVGLIVSFLTGPTDPSTIESRLLFTCLRRKFGKEHGSELEKKPALHDSNKMEIYKAKVVPAESLGLKDGTGTDL